MSTELYAVAPSVSLEASLTVFLHHPILQMQVRALAKAAERLRASAQEVHKIPLALT